MQAFGVVINSSIFPCIPNRMFFQAYLVDYYVYSSRCFPGEPPSHIGFSYILPSTLQSSVGLLTVPITSTKHRPIGMILFFFLFYFLILKIIVNYCINNFFFCRTTYIRICCDKINSRLSMGYEYFIC